MPISSGSQRIGWDAKKGQNPKLVFDGDGGHSEGLWTRSGKDEWTIRASGVLADAGTSRRAGPHVLNKGLCAGVPSTAKSTASPCPTCPRSSWSHPPRPAGSARAAK